MNIGLTRGMAWALAPFLFFAQPIGLTGTWVGSGTLTNNWTDPSDPTISLKCVYTGKAQPPSITLSLPSAAEAGQLVLDIPSIEPVVPPFASAFRFARRSRARD